MSDFETPLPTPCPVFAAIKRGLACKCPACGVSPLFDGYLEVRSRCGGCGENLSHHMADDFPPYLTIFVVGHIIVGSALMVERSTDMSTGMHLAIWIPLTIVLSLALLRPMKGGVVGLQWANRMHGFGEDDETVEPSAGTDAGELR